MNHHELRPIALSSCSYYVDIPTGPSAPTGNSPHGTSKGRTTTTVLALCFAISCLLVVLMANTHGTAALFVKPLAPPSNPPPIAAPRPVQPLGSQVSSSYDWARIPLADYGDMVTQQLKFASLRIVNDVMEYLEKSTLPKFTRRALARRRLAFGGRPVYLSRADQLLLADVNQTLVDEQWAELSPALNYLHPSARDAVQIALNVAVAAHSGQKRKSGEWFVSHPVAVAKMLAEHRMELDLVIAALLHDTVEDTKVTLQMVIRIFGHTVASLVEGVTKITELPEFDGLPSEEKNMVNLQSMLLYMASDYRVVLLKLFDRLHNMRTLMHMKPEKQRVIAQETFAIFVPIAKRLGLTDVRVELENLSFQYTYPEEYRRLNAEVEKHRQLVDKAIGVLQDQLVHDQMLKRVGIRVTTAPTEMYAMWQHMQDPQSFRAQLGLKVVLGIKAKQGENLTPYFTHTEMLLQDALDRLPLPLEVSEHVINPSSRQYIQSSFLWEQQPLNVLIFTSWMDPITAHHSFASGSVNYMRPSTYEVPWLTPIRDWAMEVPSARDFVTLVKKEVLGSRVFITLPDDTVLDMPAGATVLDAAFHHGLKEALHLEAAFVDDTPVPLDYVLQDGQFVTFKVSRKLRVKPEWASMVSTYEASRQLKWWLLSHPTRKPRPAMTMVQQP